ncbi:tetratricopeptide repeat protein, partial [Vicingaceae bacterium]|nr:tetratricopeptide repeat protein [Vicingaceae bacterium]
MVKRILILFLFSFLTFLVRAENTVLDSLLNLIKTEQDDSVLVDAYNKIGSISNREDEVLAKEYWEKALVLSEKNIAKKSSNYYLKHLATSYNGLGIMSKRGGDLPGAISLYQKSLKINEELNDTLQISTNYFNIGVIYRNLKEYDKCLDYYDKSLKLKEDLNDTTEIIGGLVSIGVIYRLMDDHDKALEFYHKGLELCKLTNYKAMEAQVYSNIGVIHNQNKDYKEAEKYFKKSFAYNSQQNNQAHIAKHHANMVNVYRGLGDFDKAIKSGEKSYEMYSEMGRLINLASVAENLSKLYSIKKEYKKSLTFFRKYISIRDSVYNDKTTKEVTQKEMQFEFDKQLMADSLLRLEAKKITALEHQQEIKQQKTYTYAGVLILAIVILFLAIVFNRLKISNRQKAIIENQKLMVEQKNKEITDSINYAKRIQTAMLPSISYLKEFFPNSFVFYKPKDIVAGDFYWFKKVNDKVFIAVADCTGHGVPGALVSVVCNNALDRAVNDFKLLDPAKILDKTTELVVEAFGNEKEDVKDGMDISLCCFDIENNKLEYAGAINSLFHIKGDDLIEIKGD